MQIEHLHVSTLIPYANNAREHSEEQVDQIAASIDKFKFNNPVLVDKTHGIVAGHGRVLAAKKLGLETVPCIKLDHLSEAEKKAYIIADNKIATNSTYNNTILGLEIESLQDSGIDLNILGFNDKELNMLSNPIKGLTDDDAVPEIPEEPVTKDGDIYELGQHILLCGDSVKEDDVKKLMKNDKAKLVFTDPPYGLEYQSNSRTKTKQFEKIKNDNQILNFIPNLEKFSTGWIFIWTTWKVFKVWSEKCSVLGALTNVIIWFKQGGGIGDLKKTFSTDYEMALVFNRGAKLVGKRIGSVWTIKKDFAANYQHPTQKPVELAIEALEKTTTTDDVVLDLFGGSGSTLIACEKLNRKARLMELDTKYCDVIIKRWEDYTGKKAKLID